MTEDLHVRSMESRDAQAVAELAGELGYARTADDVRGWLAAVGDGGAQAAFVAEADGRVVGACGGRGSGGGFAKRRSSGREGKG
jgi:hypothetical protein